MPSHRVVTGCAIARSPRVQQVEGIFDVPPADRVDVDWHADLPVDERPWHIGAIIGPSGSGKTSLLRVAFGEPKPFDWPDDEAIVDAFPADMSATDVVGHLSSVGFSSPPAWLRPYRTLSNGEQFRATLARTLAEAGDDVAVIDEFTSVVDRTVAQVASAAVAKAVRRSEARVVVASCHYDIVEWLQPDWLYDCGSYTFEWRRLRRRPAVDIEISRTPRDTWGTFRHHHYLSGSLHPASACFVATIDDRPAAFAAATHVVHPRVRNAYREHRTVCLPDFQGVGVGNAVSDFVASLFRARGFRYMSTTSHPAMIRHRARDPQWRMNRKPSFVGPESSGGSYSSGYRATTRVTAGFEYVGAAADPDLARELLHDVRPPSRRRT